MASVSSQYTLSDQRNLRITSGSKWVSSVGHAHRKETQNTDYIYKLDV